MENIKCDMQITNKIALKTFGLGYFVGKWNWAGVEAPIQSRILPNLDNPLSDISQTVKNTLDMANARNQLLYHYSLPLFPLKK